MTQNFGEQLERVLNSAINAVHGEVSRQSQSAFNEVKAIVANERDFIQREAAEDAINRWCQAAARLVDGIREMDRASSLTRIMDILAAYTAAEVPRSALLLVNPARTDAGNTLTVWRFNGFEGISTDISAEDGDLLSEAIRTGEIARTGDGICSPLFAELSSTDGRALALPISIASRVVAVLYADAGADNIMSSQFQIANATIEVMARHAARCLEWLTASGAVASGPRQPDAAANASPRHDERNEKEDTVRFSETRLYQAT